MVAGAVNLNNAALGRLPIEAPRYDRAGIGVGIAHIGAGHFHRAHQAMYIERLLQQGLAPDDPESSLAVLAAASTRIISLTITEGGYRDPDGPRVRVDHRGPAPTPAPPHRRADDRVVRQHRKQR